MFQPQSCLTAYSIAPITTVPPMCPVLPFGTPTPTPYTTHLGGNTTYCPAVEQALTTIRNSSNFINMYVDAAFQIPDLTFYFCEESAKFQNGGIGQYTASLRRIELSKFVLEDRTGLMIVLRHELFHALCHAWQMIRGQDTYDNLLNNRQPFLTTNKPGMLEDKGTLENTFYAEAKTLLTYHKNYNANDRRNLALREKVIAKKSQYKYSQSEVYKNKDPVWAAIDFIISFFQPDYTYRLQKTYRTEDQLNELLTHVIAETDIDVFCEFFPKTCGHIMAIAREVRASRIFPINSSFRNIDYSCENYMSSIYDANLIYSMRYIPDNPSQMPIYFAWIHFGLKHPKTSLLDVFYGNATRQEIRHSLETLRNSQVLNNDNFNMDFYRREMYLCFARLASQEKNYPEAEKYYKLAHKIKLDHMPYLATRHPQTREPLIFDDIGNHITALRAIGHLKEAEKLEKKTRTANQS